MAVVVLVMDQVAVVELALATLADLADTVPIHQGFGPILRITLAAVHLSALFSQAYLFSDTSAFSYSIKGLWPVKKLGLLKKIF